MFSDTSSVFVCFRGLYISIQNKSHCKYSTSLLFQLNPGLYRHEGGLCSVPVRYFPDIYESCFCFQANYQYNVTVCFRAWSWTHAISPAVVRCVPPDHLFLESAPNLGPLISRLGINKFENCWRKSVRILKVLKLLFQQFLNLSRSQRDMSGPILGALSNNRWSWGTTILQRLSSVWLSYIETFYSQFKLGFEIDTTKDVISKWWPPVPANRWVHFIKG